MKKLLPVILLLSNQAWAYSEIYVFGDSLSDTGRLYEAVGIPPSPYFEGRSSNGKVWVEYLAEKLNVTYNPKTNYAWAGATTGTANTWNETFSDAELWGMQQQIDAYLENSTSADPNGLYIVWGGANDFMGELTNPQNTMNIAITNIVTIVEKLREHGAQHLVVMNLPDMGKTPIGLASGMSAIMTGLTMAFNLKLAENLQAFKVIQADIPATLLMLTDAETFLNPVTFELNNFIDACLDSEAGTICQTPHFYWDDSHPSTQGHLAFASVLYTVVAEPIYMDDTLRLPIIEMTDNTFILDVEMVRDPNNTTFRLAVKSSVLQTTKFQDIFTFSTEAQYPKYDESTGELHLPVVQHIEKQDVVCVMAPCNPILNLLGEYTIDLNLVPVLNPFSTPLFMVNRVEPLN